MSKHRYLIWLFSFAILLSAGRIYAQEQEQQAIGIRPVAYWSMDNEGDIDGELLNGASISTESKVGSGSLMLDGEDDYLLLEDSSQITPSDELTITAWINADTWAGKNSHIVRKGGWYRLTHEWSRIVLEINAAGRLETSLPPERKWVNITACYDGLEMRIYFDGNLAVSMPACGTIEFSTTTYQPSDVPWFRPLVPRVDDSRKLYIGTSTSESSPMDFFRGYIDEVAIFDVALSQEQIQQLCNSGVTSLTRIQKRSAEQISARNQMLQQVKGAFSATKQDNATKESVGQMLSSLPSGREKVQAALIIAESFRKEQKYGDSIEFYQQVLDNSPDTVQSIYANKGKALSAIELQDDDASANEQLDTAIAGLLAEDESTDAAVAAYQIAATLNGNSRQQEAMEVFDSVVDTWPDSEEALLSSREQIFYYLAQEDKKDSADAALEKLLGLPSVQPLYSMYIWRCGLAYNSSGYSEEALALHSKNVDTIKDQHAMWSQREIAYIHIGNGDREAVEEAVDKLMTLFPQEHSLSTDLYDIGQRCSRNDMADIAAQLYQYVTATWPGSVGAFNSRREMALMALDAGENETANAEVDALINDYPDKPTLSTELVNIAARYKDANRPDEAQDLYQYVVDTWPQSDNAMSARKEIAFLQLDADNVEGAREEIDTIINLFGGNDNLPTELYNIALRFGDRGQVEDALTLHKYNSQQFPQETAAMRSLSQVVQLKIKAGDTQEAEAEYESMLEVFAEQETLPEQITAIADVYINASNFDKAVELEQSVIAQWPKTTSAMNAQLGVTMVHFAKDDLSNANTALDTLIADYNDMEGLPRAILMFGEGYYKQGLEIYKGDRPPGTVTPQSEKQKSQKNYKKSLAIWLRTINAIEATNFTADYAMTAEYYHYAGTCSRELGQYETAIQYYQKVVDNWPEYEAAWFVASLIPRMYERLKDNGSLPEEQANSLIIESYQNVIDKFPDSAAVPGVTSELKRMQSQNEPVVQVRQNNETMENLPEEIKRILSEQGGL